MGGLTGNDTYFVNDAGDVVNELAGFGTDTVWSTLATTTSANVEVLRYNGVGNFTGIGNGLDNTIAGLAGDDRLDGGDGNDVLIGGAGADALIGGAGIDTASYATADCRRSTRGCSPARRSTGGDAIGDSYVGRREPDRLRPSTTSSVGDSRGQHARRRRRSGQPDRPRLATTC